MRIVSALSSAYAISPTPNRNAIACCTKGELVGEYIPDLVVQEKLIIDTKTIDRITDHDRGQILNYLRITTLPVGIILNFKHARIEWERLVLTDEVKSADPKDHLTL
jgi:GxxExxY protein